MDRYDPFESMERMSEQMRRSMMSGRRMTFDEMRPTGALPAGDEMDVYGDEFGGTRLRMEPTDEGYVAMADIPGFEREELTVSFDDGTLSIRAVHEASDEDELSLRQHTRRVSETVRVPGDVDEEAVRATYRNGVLEVTIPTTETSDDDAHVIDVE